MWRELRADAAGTVWSILAMALASAAIVAVHQLSERLVVEVARNDPANELGLSHRVTFDNRDSAAYFTMRSRWRTGELPSVTAVVPLVETSVTVEGARYGLVGFDALSLSRVSGGQFAYFEGEMSKLSPDLLIDDVVLASSATGLTGGARVELGAQRIVVTVAGVFRDAGRQRWLLSDIATAQRIIGDDAAITAAGVAIESRVPRWLRIADALFPGLAAQARQPVPIELGGYTLVPIGDPEAARFAGAVLFNLGALSALAALVAAFLVHQNGRAHLSRRALLQERLEAMGVPDTLVRFELVLEGLLLALTGSAFGVVIGAFAADELARSTVVGAVEHAITMPSGWALAKVLAVAVLVGGGSMMLADGFTRSAAGSPAVTPFRVVGIALGAMLVVAGIVMDGLPMLAAFALIAGGAVLSVMLLAGAVQLGSVAALHGVRSLFGLLNLRAALASLPNVNAALCALLLAVATAIGMGLMVESFREAFVDMLDQRLANDLVLESHNTIGADDLARLRALDGVRSVRPYSEVLLRTADGVGVSVTASPLDADEAQRYGYAPEVPPGGMLLNEQAARALDVIPGAAVALAGERGSRELRVAHVFRDFGSARPRAVVSPEDARSMTELPPVQRVGVRLDVGASGAAVRAQAARNGWGVAAKAAVRADALDVFERTFAVSDALVAVVLVVAVIGMASAFASLAVGRAPESRLLDALGVDRRMRMRMNASQTLWLAGHVMVLAVPLGIGIGWVLCERLNPAAFGWSIPLSMSTLTLVGPVALGIVAALLAGAMTVFGHRGWQHE